MAKYRIAKKDSWKKDDSCLHLTYEHTVLDTRIDPFALHNHVYLFVVKSILEEV
jgi:hypothetical protein